MSGECEKCGEHTLECICNVKDFEVMRKHAQELHYSLIEQRQQELIDRIDKDETRMEELQRKVTDLKEWADSVNEFLGQ